MPTQNCMEMLNAKFAEGKNVCVGLDTDPKEISSKIDEFLRSTHKIPPYASQGVVMRRFNEEIIKATCGLVCAYKYNYWFYANQMYQGLHALESSIAFSKEHAPDVPIILDYKGGDVGESAKECAQVAFEKLGADAVTVNPYGGYEDGLDAFFGYKDKMIFVWCRSSASGASEFQDKYILPALPGFFSAMPLCQYAASVAAKDWNGNNNCGLVFGATDLFELNAVRRLVGGDIPILVPGIGAQGGDLEAAVEAAGSSAIFSSSRGIIYASKELDFAEAAQTKVIEMQTEIDRHRS